jgi:hypothetical protein
MKMFALPRENEDARVKRSLTGQISIQSSPTIYLVGKVADQQKVVMNEHKIRGQQNVNVSTRKEK